MGKIVVIKLCTPETNLSQTLRKTINPVEKLMYNFYGMGNRKIKKETIIQDYEYGGQNMVDIEAFIWSLKVGLVSA